MVISLGCGLMDPGNITQCTMIWQSMRSPQHNYTLQHQYSTVQYSTVQHTIQSSTGQDSTVQWVNMNYHAILFPIIPTKWALLPPHSEQFTPHGGDNYPQFWGTFTPTPPAARSDTWLQPCARFGPCRAQPCAIFTASCAQPCAIFTASRAQPCATPASSHAQPRGQFFFD